MPAPVPADQPTTGEINSLDAVVGCGEDSSPEGGMLNFEGVDTNGKWNAREYVDGIGKHTYRTSVIGNGPCARANTGLCRLYNVEVHDGVGVDVDAVVAARIGLEQGRVGVDLHAVVVLKGIFCGEGHFLAGGVTAGGSVSEVNFTAESSITAKARSAGSG